MAPIGFNWQIVVALIPGMAAREVAVGALGTVYACRRRRPRGRRLQPLIAAPWSSADRAFAARLVCLRAAMRLDPGRGQARNQFLELADHHVRLYDHLGLWRRLFDFPPRHLAARMTQTLLALGLVAVATGWIGWTYLPPSLRKKMTGRCGGCGCGG